MQPPTIQKQENPHMTLTLMASNSKLGAFIVLFSLFTLSAIIKSSYADDCESSGGAISVYWGQNTDEGTLQSACATGNYDIVILSYLIVYDDGRTPRLNLANHCGSVEKPCTRLESEIHYCQSQNIKVLLSTRIEKTTTISRSSSQAKKDVASAEKLAEYLLENYLSGQSGPLGNVALDGIDVTDVASGSNLRWVEIVKAINASTTDRKIYLSAAPQCPYPDLYLGAAIRTGLFDYIWVEFFYNPSCEYSSGNPNNLFKAWNTWTSSVLPSNSVFLGIPASPEATGSGYIPPEVLISEILPTIKDASNYGGVMLFDRYYDKKSGYSGQIKGSVRKVCKCVCEGDLSAGATFYGLFPKAM